MKHLLLSLVLSTFTSNLIAQETNLISCTNTIRHSECIIEHVSFEFDLDSFVYRYWSLYDTICSWPPSGFHYQGIAEVINGHYYLNLTDRFGSKTVNLFIGQNLNKVKIDDLVLNCQ